MWTTVQNLILVTLIAVMVWLYAEAQTLDSLVKTDLPVRILLPQGSDLIPQVELEPDRIRLEILGPAKTIESLRQELRAIELPVGQYGVPDVPGTHNLVLASIIPQTPLVSGSRVSVVQIDPPVLEMTLDRWREVDLTVQMDEIPGVDFAPGVVFNPVQVRVRIAESILSRLDSNSLRLVANPNRRDLVDIQPGVRHTVQVPLSIPAIADSSKYEITAPSVFMSFEIRSRRATVTRSAVPIHLVLPAMEQNRYRVVLEELFIPEVTVSGPQALIDRFGPEGDLRLIGYLRLSSDDLSRGIAEKTVTFDHLPDQITVDSPAFTVGLTIEPLPEPPPDDGAESPSS